MNRRDFLKAAGAAAVLPVSFVKQEPQNWLGPSTEHRLGPGTCHCSTCKLDEAIEMQWCKDHNILATRFEHESFSFGDGTGDVFVTTHTYETTKIYVEFRGGRIHQIWESPLDFDKGSVYQGNPFFGAPYLSQCRDKERNIILDEWEATVNYAMCYFEARGNKPAEFYEMCRNSGHSGRSFFPLAFWGRKIAKKPPFHVRKFGLTYQRFINQEPDRIVLGFPATWDDETLKRLRKHYV